MPRRSPFGRRLPLGTLAALLLSVACKDTNEPTSGVLRASVVTTGGDLDLDGYAVAVDAHPSRPIGVNQTVVIPGLPTGVHDVQLTGVAQNCTLAGQNPRSVSVIAADTVEVAFAVTCATTGAIQISAATSGLDPDTSGYTVQLDGGAPRALAANGLVTITGVTGGDHVVTLAGAEANCTPAGSNPRTVQVTTGGTTRDTARTTFEVTCVATTGVIEVTIVTSGADLDPDGYYIEVDSSRGPIAANETIHLTGVRGGSHQVWLDAAYMEENCALWGENPRTLSVTIGSGTRDTVRTTFEITCAALGSIEVTTRTTGVDPDPNGYLALVSRRDFGYAANAEVPASGTVTIHRLVAAGDYGVGLDLGSVTMNCDVVSPNPRTVTVPSGGTAAVAFDVTCAQAAQLAVSLRVNGNWDIYTLKSNGARLTRLTTYPGYNVDPAWSPDGSKIAFQSGRDGNDEIYVMNADGTSPTRLTTNLTRDDSPTWSPDGTRIAFTSYRDDNADIYVMSADGTNPVRLTNHPAYDAYPAWSPDGSKIAFMSARDDNWEIYVMTADGTNPVRLTNHPTGDESPAWSPDGTKLVFSRLTECDSQVCDYDLYVMNADGSGAAQLTSGSIDDYPAWSPDGRWIAFGAFCYYCGFSGVHVVRTDGTRVVELLRDAYYPAWRP